MNTIPHIPGPRAWALKPLCLAVARALMVLGAGATAGQALAAPQGGAVVAGQASIHQAGATTTVNQNSQRAVIDWRSFNVEANERVRFEQPNAQAATLNRVTGDQASRILGRLDANGQVYLVNPNGIVFGRGAQVNTGSLLATTQDTRNADFMAGHGRFDQPGKPGAQVVNEGQITVADGGFAALVGQHVANSGSITARLGKISLAAGDAFVLDLYGDQLVNLLIEPTQLSSLRDASGQSLSASVDHSGRIIAEGGRVQLSAATVRQLVDKLINVSGVVRATGFEQHAGGITLTGDAGTTLAVASSATLDAGASGGAPAGDVSLVSEGSAAFAGRIRGQDVEVSGRQHLVFTGDVHARNLLIDPANLTIAATGATSLPAAGSTGDSTIAVETINRQLRNGTSVSLQADQNLSVNAQIDGRGGSANGAGLTLEATQGDLAINAPIVLVGNGGLQATAGGRITQASGKLVYADAGAISLSGAQGIQADVLATTGAIDLRSAQGGISAHGLYGLSGNNLAEAASVGVHALGAVGLGHVNSAGNITVDGAATGASAASLSVEQGAVLRARDGAVSAKTTGDIRLAGTAPANAGDSRGGIAAGKGITLVASAGAIDTSAGLLQTSGQVIKLDADKLVSVGQVVARNVGSTQAGEGVLDVTSRSGDVVLTQALGGANTGYRYLGEGYLEELRPDVGRVLISAPRGSVETNGLNLDGNADPRIDANSDTVTRAGLNITAGHRIIVNEQIAVNKGAIQLTTAGTEANDLVFLGSNLYQRGYTPAGTLRYMNSNQWVNNSKVTYAIRLNGRGVAVWDSNENGVITLRSGNSPTSTVLGYTGKVVVSNNPAVFSCEAGRVDCDEATALVGRVVFVSTNTGCNVCYAPANSIPPVAAVHLSVQGNGSIDPPYAASEDQTRVAGVAFRGIAADPFRISGVGAGAGLDIRLNSTADLALVPQSQVSFTGEVRGENINGSGIMLKILVAEGGGDRPSFVGTMSLGGSGFTPYTDPGRAENFNVGGISLNGIAGAQLFNHEESTVSGLAISPAQFGGVSGTVILVYDGAISHGSGSTGADSTGSHLSPGSIGSSAANNANFGFAPMGGFGLSTPTALPGVSDSSWVNEPAVSPLVLNEAEAKPTKDGLTLALWPGRDADLGRNGAGSGFAISPFGRTYRLATNSNTAVCAPEALQSATATPDASAPEAATASCSR